MCFVAVQVALCLLLGLWQSMTVHSCRRIEVLSDGLKSRVVFALMAQRTPHILLLDEPTNHLDMSVLLRYRCDVKGEGVRLGEVAHRCCMPACCFPRRETIDALAECLNVFEGGVVLVSHDMRLISQVAKEVWECKDRVRAAVSSRHVAASGASTSWPVCVQTITRFEGTIAEYKAKLKEEISASEREFERANAMSSEVKTKAA